MGPPPPGFRLIWDATSFDGTWVLLPGCVALALAATLLAVRRRSAAPARMPGIAAMVLGLGAVWWTLGGIGAWRAGAGRLVTGTANFVDGTVTAQERGPGGGLERFEVGGLPFHRAHDAWLPALHAARWPPLTLGEGTPVRLWFFGDDLLRVEAGGTR